MRRLLSLACAGEELAGSLDGAGGAIGLLLVTGGSQTRIGSHRMYERLAKSLAELGYPCLRYDRRGVGDSSGEDPGFRGSGPDLAAAAAAFRRESRGLERIVGFGLCDGASALALFGRQAGLDGLILVNPWLVEAEAGDQAPAAIRAHYRQRLLSREGWKKLLSGSVDWKKLLKGVRKISAKEQASPLARDCAAALAAGRLRAWAILAEGDGTAIAAQQELKAPAFKGLIEGVQKVASDSHTFARPGDEAALLAATVRALEALST
ncbi:MAG: hydrolase 1, exosortase A system-associated [Sphingomonadaceae bacterium]|nr:hydrolase 1, exosortase A system-associated [Sphingomonadaceae bacterium]